MEQTYFISIYLDTRRAKLNNKFPVKLRVFTKVPRKQKLYPTIFEYTEKEFNSIWNTTKPRREYIELREELLAIQSRAISIAKELDFFSFEQFEKKLIRNTSDGTNIEYLYNQKINELNKLERIGSASSYECSKKSLQKFVEKTTNQSFRSLTLNDITTEWLSSYEYFMTKVEGNSQATVGVYLRALRALFNDAIEDKEINKDYYPFAKRKYTIPATKNKKIALSSEQLKILFHSKPRIIQQEKAKDFWFFSYACNGINMKDIALLKYKDIKDDRIEIYRAKTKQTSKANLKNITIYLNDFSKGIIEKYGNKDIYPDNFIFNIIDKTTKPKDIKTKVNNFTKLVNQHIKKLCVENELPSGISTNWARHSFATNSVRNGASLEFMRESLGHSDLKTTMGYFAGFEDETKKEFAKQLMNF
jgi:site-specific recombinase XerD